jgi:hypothetical protein
MNSTSTSTRLLSMVINLSLIHVIGFVRVVVPDQGSPDLRDFFFMPCHLGVAGWHLRSGFRVQPYLAFA